MPSPMLSRALVALVLFTVSTASVAQNPPPAGLPNLALKTSGVVTSIVRQSDGKLIIGGIFSEIDGTPRANLARLNSDGSLDTGWNPAPNSSVNALAIDGSDNLYVGGTFVSIAGAPRSRLARLTVAGALDTAWLPAGASGTVRALTRDASGALYVGGSFVSIGGFAKRRLAKLTAAGAVDLPWTADVNNGFVRALALDAAGDVYVGGTFTSVGPSGMPLARSRLAKALSAGTFDAVWNPGADLDVYSLVTYTDGLATRYVFVAGAFSNVGGLARPRLAKLAGTGSGAADPTWLPAGATGAVARALFVDSAASLLYVGSVITSIGGVPRHYAARVGADGVGVVDSWAPTLDNGLQAALKVGTDVYLVGAFDVVNSAVQCGVARVDSGAGATVAALPQVLQPGEPFAIGFQSNGGTILGGNFVRAGAVDRAHLLRLDASGNLDPVWAPFVDGPVGAVAIDASGDAYIGGRFDRAGGSARVNLAKVSGSGTGALDPSWAPSTDADVNVIAADFANATLYIGGLFTQAGGVVHGGLAKVSTAAAGAVDPAWKVDIDPGTNVAPNFVGALVLDAGALFVGGQYTTLTLPAPTGTVARNHLAKLSAPATPTLDASWNPAPDGSIATLAAGGGELFVGGNFNNIGGAAHPLLAKLQSGSTGAADPGWFPFPDAVPTALVYDGSGSVFASGPFSRIADQPRSWIAKLGAGGNGALDLWNPTPDVWADAMAVRGGNLYIGGSFLRVGTFDRGGIALLPQAPTGAPSTTTITAHTPNPSPVNGAVIVTISVPGAAPSETVRVVASSGESCVTAPPSGSCQLVFASAGGRTITATYSGGVGTQPSASTPVSHTVDADLVFIDGYE